jgi:hypothetical protein
VETTASAAGSRALCLRLQRGGGLRGWGRDGLGTGRRGEGAEGAEGVDVAFAQIGHWERIQAADGSSAEGSAVARS